MHTQHGVTRPVVLTPSKSMSAVSPIHGRKPTSKRGLLQGAVFAAACLPAVAVAVPTYTVTDLGTLGGMYSYGRDINASGQVTGDTSKAGSGAYHAFLYSAGTMTELGTSGLLTSGVAESVGAGINNSGQVTGWVKPIDGGPTHAFLFSGGVMTDLGTLGGIVSVADSINASGLITGRSDTTSGATHAFLYSAGTMTDLGTLGKSSVGHGINARGQVTGESSLSGGGEHAFLYSAGAMTDLGTLGGLNSQGVDINDSGQITGSSQTTTGGERAFLFSDGRMTDLGSLGGNSVGLGINAHGQVVGVSLTSSGSDARQHAFLYSEGAMYDLNSLLAPGFGSILKDALGINDSGQIVANSSNHAYLLTPVTTVPEPTPATLLLLGFGIMGLVGTRCRKSA